MRLNESSPSTSNVDSRPGRQAQWLAYAGLLPFVIGALLIWIVRRDVQGHVSLGLSAYAGVIVSFLGGIHWGFGIRSPQPDSGRFVWAIVPSLIAWPAILMPPHAALVLHGVTLIACYLVDRKVYPRHHAAGWLTLRFRLTAVASLSCFLGAAGI